MSADTEKITSQYIDSYLDDSLSPEDFKLYIRKLREQFYDTCQEGELWLASVVMPALTAIKGIKSVGSVETINDIKEWHNDPQE